MLLQHDVVPAFQPLFLIGVELSEPAAPLVDRARDAGLIINAAGTNVLRFAPPLTVTAPEVDEALRIVGEVLES